MPHRNPYPIPHRSGDIDAAVHLAQSALASLDVPSGSPSRPGGSLTAGGDAGSGGGGGVGDTAGDPSRTLLRDIVALVAYEKPEDSPLVGLLRDIWARGLTLGRKKGHLGGAR